MLGRAAKRHYTAASDSIAAYQYRAEIYSPEEIIEVLIADGLASPAARDMGVEEALDQIAEANAIDRMDEYSFDSDEFPKVVFADQLRDYEYSEQMEAEASRTSTRRVAWTADGSDITPMADKLMSIDNDVRDETGTTSYSDTNDPARVRDMKMMAERIAPFLDQITQADLDVLEDYNYHTMYAAVEYARTGQLPRHMASRRVARALNEIMDFDNVIEVLEDGSVVERPDIYPPDLHVSNDGEWELDGWRGEWELLNGYSGQYRYSGPLMHSSEYIGGGMERDILAEPGVYVAIVAYPMEGEDEYGNENVPSEWAVARLKNGRTARRQR